MLTRDRLLSILIALTAVFLLQQGITGFYLMDFQQNTCLSDSDCAETCCPVYGEEYGICDLESNCGGVYDATKEVSSHQSSMSATELKSYVREVSFQQNYIAISLGIILAAIVLLVAYHERKPKKRKSR